jgi:hypothetical protein
MGFRVQFIYGQINDISMGYRYVSMGMVVWLNIEFLYLMGKVGKL